MTAPISTQADLPASGAGISEEERTIRVNRVGRVTSLIILALGIAAVVTAFTQKSTQLIPLAVVLVGIFLLQTLISQNLLVLDTQKKVFVLALSMEGALILTAVYIGGTALPVAGIILIFALMCSITLLDNEKSEAIVPLSLMGAVLAGLMGTYSPVPQVSQPFFVYLLGGIFVSILLTFIVLLMTGKIVARLGIKITLAALFIVIFPLTFLTLIDSAFLRRTLLTETESSLISASNLLANRLEEFNQTNRYSIASEASLPLFGNYLQLSMGQRRGSAQEKQLLTAVSAIKANMKAKEIAYMDAIKLLDSNGFVSYSTRATEIGSNEKSRSYFAIPMATSQVYDSPVEFSPSDSKPYLYFSQVVRNSDQQIAGVLVISFQASILQNMAKEYMSEGMKDSYPLLLDENYMRLADTMNEKLLYTTLLPFSDQTGWLLRSSNRLPNQAAATLNTNQADFAANLKSYLSASFFTADVANDGRQYYTAVVRMTGQTWYVAFARDVTKVADLLENQTRLSVIIATLIAGAISMLATYIAQSFSQPISQLTQTAHLVSTGNLEARSQVTSKDEIGILANAFNTMTDQLQRFIAGLEDRVRARTRELADRNDALTFRARQLETIAEVARGVNQSQSLESLLTNVARLISDRFNFYHVGIFLLDDSGKFAVLRAANSEGGQRMLARQHRLEIGQTGIVGYATASGEARIATDVGQDAVFFNNPDLPLTRSEMALPLMTGDRIIGALDVQSVESAAFSSEDIQLFKILADQVAMAINNSQLYTETRQALKEAQLVHQRYLQQEWSRETAQNPHTGYRYTPAGVHPVSKDGVNLDLPEADSDQGLTVPVKLRGETIGVIRIQDESSAGQWAEDEINTVQAVADQVALALENARLFTQTTRKAERERRVLEITSRIRSTNDPQVMMQIAVEELQRTLQASRAQVVLQPATPGGNGSNGHHGPNGNNGHKTNQEHSESSGG